MKGKIVFVGIVVLVAFSFIFSVPVFSGESKERVLKEKNGIVISLVKITREDNALSPSVSSSGGFRGTKWTWWLRVRNTQASDILLYWEKVHQNSRGYVFYEFAEKSKESLVIKGKEERVFEFSNFLRDISGPAGLINGWSFIKFIIEKDGKQFKTEVEIELN